MRHEQETMELFTGRQERDYGIKKAEDHADEDSPGWTEKALDFLRAFPGDEFQIEDVRTWAERHGLPSPPHKRAWGSVALAARRKGLIEHVGYEQVKNPKAHCAPCSVWRRTGISK